MMFVTYSVAGSAGVVVVDAPPSIGASRILSGIASVTSASITHVVYSHGHADHIAASGQYPPPGPNVQYIAHALVDADLRRPRLFPYGVFTGGGAVPFPTVTFTTAFNVTVGGRTILAITEAPFAHSPGNVFIVVPNTKIAMIVDIVFTGWVPFVGLAAEDTIGFYESHDIILNTFTAPDFVFVTGHLGRLATRDDVITQKAYITDLLANSITASAAYNIGAVGSITGFENSWLLFKTFADLVTQKCVDLTLAQWGGRLGGADIFAFSHCERVTEILRIV